MFSASHKPGDGRANADAPASIGQPLAAARGHVRRSAASHYVPFVGLPWHLQ